MSTDVPVQTFAYYRPSGRFTFRGLVFGFVSGAVVACVTGIAYAYVAFYNPFIYINFLLTCLFAYITAQAVRRGIVTGKVRAPLPAALVGGAAALVGLYAAWVVWIQILFGTGPQGQHMWVFDPLSLLETIGVVASQGVWSVFGVTPTDGGLFAVWLLEAAIIIGGAAVLCMRIALHPFCENCACWAEARTEDLQLQDPEDPATLRSDLERGRTDAIMSLARVDLEALDVSRPVSFLNLSLLTCPMCDDVGFVSIESIGLQPSKKKGQLEKSSRTIVANLQLGQSPLQELRELAAVIAAEDTAGESAAGRYDSGDARGDDAPGVDDGRDEE